MRKHDDSEGMWKTHRDAARADATPTIAWSILLPMTAGFFFITGILLWLGAVVQVRCERGADGRVDVTVEQRMLGLVTVRSTHLTDVVRAQSVQRPASASRGSRTRVGPQLKLTLRDGSEWESLPAATHIAGASPVEIAKRLQQFLEQPSESLLTLRWIPWLMCALAVPFILFSALFAAACINTLRRQLAGS